MKIAEINSVAVAKEISYLRGNFVAARKEMALD